MRKSILHTFCIKKYGISNHSVITVENHLYTKFGKKRKKKKGYIYIYTVCVCVYACAIIILFLSLRNAHLTLS